MAWRVTGARSESAVAESGPAPMRRTSASRVSLPRAKNTPATTGSALDMLPQVGRLCDPAALVHAERALATVRRDTIEARLHDRQPRAFRDWLEPELDQGLGLSLGVGLRV